MRRLRLGGLFTFIVSIFVLFVCSSEVLAVNVATPWGASVTSVGTIAAPFGADYVVDSDGNILVGKVYSNSGYKIAVQKYDAAGDPVWNSGSDILIPVVDDQSSVNTTSTPQVVSDGNGGMYIGYVSVITSTSASSLYIQHISSAGTVSFGVNGMRVTTGADTRSQADGNGGFILFPDGSGGAVVVWQSSGSSPSYQLRMQKINAAGTRLLGDTGTVLADNTIFPAAALDGAGNLFIAWGNTGGGNVLAQKYNFATGAEVWADPVAIASLGSLGNFYYLSPDNEGGVYMNSGNTFTYIASDGSTPWGSTALSPDSSIDQVPHWMSAEVKPIATDGEGNLVLAGYDYSEGEIVLQKIDQVGDNVWSPVTRTISAPSLSNGMALEATATGNILVSWYSSDTDIVYTNKYGSNGQALWDASVEMPGSTLNGPSSLDSVGSGKTLVTSYCGASLGCMQMIQEAFQVGNVPSGLNIFDSNDNNIEDGGSDGILGEETIQIQDADTDAVVAEVTINLQDNDLDLSGVTADSDLAAKKTFIDGFAETPGVNSGTTLLYVPKGAGDNRVYYCPNATSLADVTTSCSGGSSKQESDSDVSVVTIGPVTYWVITGVTDGGGISYLYTAPSQGQGNSGSSGPLPPIDSTSTPGCFDWRPIGTPDLFQIDRVGTTAKLHFTPVSERVQRYSVIFGFSEGEERFGGISIPVLSENQGVQSMVIENLDPKASYWFKVIPVNGCATGDWSNWLQAERVKGKSSIFYRYLPAMFKKAL